MEVYPLKILKSFLRYRVSLRLSSGKFLPKKALKVSDEMDKCYELVDRIEAASREMPQPKRYGVNL
jgi:hypothetical protein